MRKEMTANNTRNNARTGRDLPPHQGVTHTISLSYGSGYEDNGVLNDDVFVVLAGEYYGNGEYDE